MSIDTVSTKPVVAAAEPQLFVADMEIRQLSADFHGAGVSFAQRLTTKPWGALDFIIQDPDGNLLLFAGPAE
jgi:glyoxalase/bleomycin resistance protein/dioxygenase superfamily protein